MTEKPLPAVEPIVGPTAQTPTGGPRAAPEGLSAGQRRRTAHELVRDTLRRSILNGTLAGGTRLVQAEIAAQLQMSTTPVREALRDLAADGLIRIDPHRGGIVHTVDAEEFREIYEIRRILEPYAMRLASDRVEPAELEAAGDLVAAMRDEQDPGAWAELNWRFHRTLVLAARSPRLTAIVNGMQDAAALYVAGSIRRTPGRIAQGNLEHEALLDALRRGDPETAATLAGRHLEGTAAAFEQAASAGPPQP